MSDSKRSDNPGLAMGWMAGAVTSLLMMGVAGRELAAELQPHHSAFYRNAVCLLILIPLVAIRGWDLVRTRRFARHAVRNSVHFGGQWCWLYGLGVLPFAEVFSIEFTAPLCTALLACVFLGEPLNRWRMLAVALGLAGIIVILRPGAAILDPAAFVVLAGAFGYAVTYVLTKSLVTTESSLAIVWWMNVVQLPLGLVLSVGNLIVPSAALWPWILVIGLSGLGSHYCLGRALAVADATIVIPMDFLRLPLAAVTAWLLYSEQPDRFLVAGAALILLGNWINLRRTA